jgi:hypothetical protein
MKRLYVTFVAASMFVIRSVALFFMILLQRYVGGADVRPHRTA